MPKQRLPNWVAAALDWGLSREDMKQEPCCKPFLRQQHPSLLESPLQGGRIRARERKAAAHPLTKSAIWKGEAAQNGAARAPSGINRVCFIGNLLLKQGQGAEPSESLKCSLLPPATASLLLLN